MPSSVQTLAGSVLAISAGIPATEDIAGYDALTYTDVGLIVDRGELGATYNISTLLPLKERNLIKAKGSVNYGSVPVNMARVDTDAGQILMRTALNDDADYSISFTYQDGSIDYFKGKVTKFSDPGGGSEAFSMRSGQIEANSLVVEKPAP